MSRAATRARGSSPRQAAQNALLNYFKQSEKPLASLVFILPLVIIHEVGWRFVGARLLAFSLLHQFLSLLGAPGLLLPALFLVGILLGWHIASRDKWTVHVDTILGMALESFLLALPLLALAGAIARWRIHPLLAAGGPWLDQVVIAMGAGIYEELIFRLIGFTLLNLLLVDLLGISKTRSTLLMVGLSGVGFSLYHYLGSEQFSWRTCLFRSIAGIYFGGIFICRGFGITAGCHAAYDIIICSLAM
jgi:hypothetical protein